MKFYAYTILLLIGLVLVFPNPVFAWTHCGTPQAEDDCPKPTHSPTIRPTGTPRSTPTATASATITPSPTPEIILNLPSNASDGLGCAQHECKAATPAPSPQIENKSLPVTGVDNSTPPQLMAGIFGLSFGFGLILRGLGTSWESEE